MDVIDGKWIAERLTGKHGERAELARFLGVKPDIVTKILSGGRRVQPEEIPLVLEYFKARGLPQEVPTEAADHSAGSLVPVYDVTASAGHGAVVEDENHVSSLAFPPGYLRRLTSAKPRDLAIITVKGDSMLPTINEDDVVMLDMSKRDLSYDGLFVLRDNGDGLLVKRIGRATRGGYVSLISDNRSLYHVVERAIEDIEVIGKVIWHGRKV